MAFYLILDNEVHDADAYEGYLQAAPEFVKKYGGEYLVRGGAFEVVAGNWAPKRLVIFRYPSREAIDEFLADPDYQPWKKIREAATTTHNILIVEGV